MAAKSPEAEAGPAEPVRRRLTLFALLAATALCGTAIRAEEAPGKRRADASWRRLEQGLDFGVFDAGRRSDSGDSKIRILRIDPEHFDLVLLNVTALPGQEPLSAREWSRRHGLVAAINPSMFQKDHRRSVSLMRTGDHVNNPRVSKDMSILAFDPVDPEMPPVRIIDRQCDDFEELRNSYRSLVQSIRMISCKGENVWSPGKKAWSTAAVGIDTQGRVMFIHSRSPYTTHDFIEILKALPIHLERAMYGEGGPQAQLYIDAGGRERELLGSVETGFVSEESVKLALPMPNVLGIRRRGTRE